MITIDVKIASPITLIMLRVKSITMIMLKGQSILPVILEKTHLLLVTSPTISESFRLIII